MHWFRFAALLPYRNAEDNLGGKTSLAILLIRPLPVADDEHPLALLDKRGLGIGLPILLLVLLLFKSTNLLETLLLTLGIMLLVLIT